MLTTKEVFIKVKELLQDPARWTKGAFAKNRHGKLVGPNNTGACCFCLSGALNKIGHDYVCVTRVLEARRILAPLIDYQSVPVYNDIKATTHESLMLTLDKAILAAE